MFILVFNSLQRQQQQGQKYQMNTDQNSQINSTSEKRREQLIYEIEAYNEKIKHYEQIESEINQLSIVIDEPKSIASQREKQSKLKSMTQTQRKRQLINRRNSNKKIKVYDMKKKLDKIINQRNEKVKNYQINSQTFEKLQNLIKNLSQKIQQEKQTCKNLNQLQQRVLGDVAETQQKVITELDFLQQSVKNKEMFIFERRKLRDQLRRLKSMISKLSNTKDFQLSLSNENEIDQYQSHLRSNDPQTYFSGSAADYQTSILLNRQKQRIQQLFNKLGLFQQKNNQMVHLYYEFKKKFCQNQIIVKHHKLTINLHTIQIQKYSKIIQQINETIYKSNGETQLLSNQLRIIQGQSGYLRGKIGVLIQQQRMLKGINILAEKDKEQLDSKISQLKLFKQLFHKKIQTLSN